MAGILLHELLLRRLDVIRFNGGNASVGFLVNFLILPHFDGLWDRSRLFGETILLLEIFDPRVVKHLDQWQALVSLVYQDLIHEVFIVV